MMARHMERARMSMENKYHYHKDFTIAARTTRSRLSPLSIALLNGLGRITRIFARIAPGVQVRKYRV
ncbi:MAG TPA: hypothetical protein DD727_02835, partial [Clostridiales bacterium]|nr:hypothetical protein [Clostridiales bacterium]